MNTFNFNAEELTTKLIKFFEDSSNNYKFENVTEGTFQLWPEEERYPETIDIEGYQIHYSSTDLLYDEFLTISKDGTQLWINDDGAGMAHQQNLVPQGLEVLDPAVYLTSKFI